MSRSSLVLEHHSCWTRMRTSGKTCAVSQTLTQPRWTRSGVRTVSSLLKCEWTTYPKVSFVFTNRISFDRKQLEGAMAAMWVVTHCLTGRALSHNNRCGMQERGARGHGQTTCSSSYRQRGDGKRAYPLQDHVRSSCSKWI